MGPEESPGPTKRSTLTWPDDDDVEKDDDDVEKDDDDVEKDVPASNNKVSGDDDAASAWLPQNSCPATRSLRQNRFFLARKNAQEVPSLMPPCGNEKKITRTRTRTRTQTHTHTRTCECVKGSRGGIRKRGTKDAAHGQPRSRVTLMGMGGLSGDESWAHLHAHWSACDRCQPVLRRTQA